MAQIVEINNPFKPFEDSRTTVHAGGISIRAFLFDLYGPHFVDFSKPTVCLVNGTPMLRTEWGSYRIKKNDVINFVTFPGEPVTILYWVYAIVLIALVAFVLTTNVPNTGLNGSPPEPGSVF